MRGRWLATIRARIQLFGRGKVVKVWCARERGQQGARGPVGLERVGFVRMP